MYRDDLEALRERSRDLDRELATARARRPPPAAPKKAPLPVGLGWMVVFSIVGLLLLLAGARSCLQVSQLEAPYRPLRRGLSAHMLTPQWIESGTVKAHIVSKDRNGTACTITLSPPCRAEVLCGGKVLYRGTGACRPSGFVDRGDSFVDGTPQCEIDLAAGRATVREVACHRRASDAFYATKWQVDLEVP